MGMQPPAEDVPETIHINQAKLKYANDSIRTYQSKKEWNLLPGERSESSLQKSGKYQACKNRVKNQRGEAPKTRK